MNRPRVIAIAVLAALCVAGYFIAERAERHEIAKCAASCPPGQVGQRDTNTDTEPPVCWCARDSGDDDVAAQRSIAGTP